MAGANEKYLVEIITAANLAGVNQVQKSFLGLGASTLGLAAVLYAIIEVGKQALANYQQQEDALSSLTQAVDAHNAQVGKAIPATKQEADALARSRDELTRAKRALQEFDASHNEHVSTQVKGLTKLQQMRREDIQAKIASAKTTAQLEKAERQLAEFDAGHQAKTGAGGGLTEAQAMKREDLVNKVAKAQANLKSAQADANHGVVAGKLNLDELNKAIDAFIQKNAGYISSQYDAKNAAAKFVLAGNDEKDTLRLLNDALDLAAVKHEDLSTAADQLVLAENGNSKGLRDLGITTDQVNTIMKSHLTTEQKHAALLALIEAKTAKGRDTVSQYQQSQNRLNKDWQDFTSSIGPGLTNAFTQVFGALDTGVQILQLADQLMVNLGHNAGAVQNLMIQIAKILPGAQAILQLYGLATNVASHNTTGTAGPAGHVAKQNALNAPSTGHGIVIQVNGAKDPMATARQVSRHLKPLLAT